MILKAVNALKALRFTAINLSKAKSERINALRKQYDAFLEEDRKRKDRNDYIMGWLDRVRVSPTSSLGIQERSADSLQIPLLHQPKYTHKYQPNQHATNIKNPFNENLDESVILKAVSQKYILIPKSSLKYENKFNFEKISSIKNDLDWRRKYDILNDLKQEEKEEKEISDNRESIAISTKDIAKFGTKPENISENKASTFHFNNPPQEDTLCEQNLSKQNGQYKLEEKNDCFFDNTTTKYDETETKPLQDSSEKDNMSQDFNIQESELQTQNNNIKRNYDNEIQEQPKSIPIKEIEENDELTERYSLQTNENNDKIVKNASAEQFEAESHVDELLSDNIFPISTAIHSVVATNDVVSPQHNSSFVTTSETNDATQYYSLSAPQQTEKNKDLIKESKQSPDTNKLSLLIQNSEFDSERQPETEITGPKTIDNTMDDQSQIEDFEKEQKELFYTEDQNLNNTYDEEQVTSNDNYENNEQYPYYEATKEDQNNYAADLNEYEETTEQYDPRYQVQYGVPNDETQLHTQYPTEGYSQNDGEDLKQQQYYENYEEHQIDDTMVREQQHYDNSVYEEQQENTDNLYVQDYSQEIPSQKETLENMVENQLNIEDGYVAATEAVSNNEECSTSENILAST